MSSQDIPEARFSLKQAQAEFLEGRKEQAYWWAAKAARLAPELEEPWLLLASVASPQASEAYLRRALEINPGSQRAADGLQWARQRAGISNENHPEPVMGETMRVQLTPHPKPTRKNNFLVAVLPYLFSLSLICVVLFGLGVIGIGSMVVFPEYSPPRQTSLVQQVSGPPPVVLPPTSSPSRTINPSRTPNQTATIITTSTPQPSETPQPTPTLTGVPVVFPTFIAAAQIAIQPGLQFSQQPQFYNPGYYQPVSPGKSGNGGRWIDVNLSR